MTTRSITLGAIIFALLAGTAIADSVKAPAGWKSDAPAAVSMSQQLGTVSHFGCQRSIVTTEIYR
ncbi:MAG: hypothetical protein H0V17_30875, partial [Deltaproteobacteria bacterium]|nr:hypothetical protein [Deltaproteobacteria bacterium]